MGDTFGPEAERALASVRELYRPVGSRTCSSGRVGSVVAVAVGILVPGQLAGPPGRVVRVAAIGGIVAMTADVVVPGGSG